MTAWLRRLWAAKWHIYFCFLLLACSCMEFNIIPLHEFSLLVSFHSNWNTSFFGRKHQVQDPFLHDAQFFAAWASQWHAWMFSLLICFCGKYRKGAPLHDNLVHHFCMMRSFLQPGPANGMHGCFLVARIKHVCDACMCVTVFGLSNVQVTKSVPGAHPPNRYISPRSANNCTHWMMLIDMSMQTFYSILRNAKDSEM